MSTKTSIKRIALVAVSALGLGVLTSVAPASAAAKSITSLTVGTLSPVRAGVSSNLPVTATFATAGAADADTVTVVARVISAPTGSTLINASSATPNGSGGNLTITDPGVGDWTGSAAAVHTDFTNASGNKDAQAYRVLTVHTAAATSGTFYVSFKADVAGTYQILVSGNNTSYTAGDPSTVLTVTTAGTPTSMSFTTYGAVVENGPALSAGAVIKVVLKDANGNATILGPTEAINVATSNTTTTSLSAATLTAPSSSGKYTINVLPGTIAADGSAVITFTGSGTLASTFTSNTTVSVVNTATTTTQLTLTSATGYAGTTPTYYTAAKSSHGYTYTQGSAAADDTNYAVLVDATGTGAVDYSTYVTVAKGEKTGTISVSQALSALGVTAVSVGTYSAGSATASPIVVNREAAVANQIAIVGSASVLSATGAANKFTVAITDQYGNALANQAVSVSVSGRNTVASTALGVTDANGQISYTLTDAGTTGTTDSVVFAATLTTPGGSLVAATTGGTATGTVSYGTVTVGSVTVSGGSKAETVAGSTLTAISAADNGPEASAVAITATVKDANGNLLAGVPVTFSVDKGLIKKSAGLDYATVYTGSNGKATTYVFNWVPGTQTITATAGGKSSTDYLTWAATDATSARVLSATANGNVVSVKVVDRFGNAVKGVSVDLSRVGTGFFGNGTSTATVKTDATGTADIQFNGTATVTATLDTAVYTQSADVAGEIDATAVTAAVAGTTKGTGASLAPAGVNKVSVDLTDSSSAAVDAANEATDAVTAVASISPATSADCV